MNPLPGLGLPPPIGIVLDGPLEAGAQPVNLGRLRDDWGHPCCSRTVSGKHCYGYDQIGTNIWVVVLYARTTSNLSR